MIPTSFDYEAPTTLADAVAALGKAGDDAKVLGGGQSLMPILRMRLNAPEVIIDLSRVDELRGISSAGGGLTIGAMTTYKDILDSADVASQAAVLTAAVRTIGDWQIRNLGTLGGALVHADPAGDPGAAALALDATMVITGPKGEREVAATDFFTDVFTSAVGEDEILTAIRIPSHAGWGGAYEKFQRTAQQWAIVGVAATAKVEGGKIADVRVGLTNMGSTPLRATALEAALKGASASDPGDVWGKAAEGTDPPSDLNGSADYRRHLVGVLAKRAVMAAVAAA